MIAIGYMAFGFAIVCAIILVVFRDYPNEKPVKNVDYRKIYEKLVPKEL